MSNKGAKARLQKGPAELPKASPRKVSRQDAHPFFCFKHIDKSTKGSYGFALNTAESKEVLDFACEMAQHTWTQIEQMTTGGRNGHRKHHEQSVEEIERCARQDLTRRELDEVIGDAPLFRFRLGNKKRLWGFRSGQVFHAIWLDRKHAVYKLDEEKPKRARKERRKKRK
ncbi:MAG TPA: hypothetical protein VGO36_04235 [Solirubrobacterales bacterium]|nr:hypothetical protein [Solirubrobacterales bacterium]